MAFSVFNNFFIRVYTFSINCIFTIRYRAEDSFERVQGGSNYLEYDETKEFKDL